MVSIIVIAILWGFLSTAVIVALGNTVAGLQQRIAGMLQGEEQYVAKIVTLQQNLLSKEKRIFGLKEALNNIASDYDSVHSLPAKNALAKDRKMINEG